MSEALEEIVNNARSEHHVRFYRNLDALAQEVARHLGQGLSRGEPAVAILRPVLASKVIAYLNARGLSRATQSLFVLDARKTLDTFMVNGRPDRTLYRAAVEPHMRRCTSESPRVHLFGEMVALLCEQGLYGAAIELEELWNELGNDYVFSLLCAYPLRLFSSESSSAVFRRICGTHGHVSPTEDAQASACCPALGLALAQLEQKSLALEILSSRYRALLDTTAAEGSKISSLDLSVAHGPVGRVLVVHENTDIAAHFSEMMEASGWETCVAHDAAQALQVLPAFQPDTVMLQLGLANVPSLDLARRIRETLGGLPCRLFALTKGTEQPGAHDKLFDAYLIAG